MQSAYWHLDNNKSSDHEWIQEGVFASIVRVITRLPPSPLMSDDELLLPELWDLIFSNVDYDDARRCFLVCRAWMRVLADPSRRCWRAIFMKTGALRPPWPARNWRDAARTREPTCMIAGQPGLVDMARVREIRDHARARLGAWLKTHTELKIFDDQTRHAYAALVTSLDIEHIFYGPSRVTVVTTACMGASILMMMTFSYDAMMEGQLPGGGLIRIHWRGYTPATTAAFPPIQEQHENRVITFRPLLPSVGPLTLNVHWSGGYGPHGCGPDAIATPIALINLYVAGLLAFAPRRTAADDIEERYQQFILLVLQMALYGKARDEHEAERDAWHALVAD
jgi:hypothetical protein